MAYGVQLSSKYVLIGGPREVGAGRTNYIGNPEVRYDTTGWVSATRSWTFGAGQTPYGILISGSTTGIITATYNLDLVALGLVPGMTMTLSGDYQLNDAPSGTSRFDIVYYSDAFITPIQTDLVNFGAQGTGGRISVTNTIPATAINARVRMRLDNSGGGSYAAFGTALQLNEGTNAIYFNGDWPGYYWVGDEHDSPSAQDGTRAVLNDDTDLDFVGYAAEVTGLEGAEVRENSVDNIEADGALHGEFYQGRRPVTITAAIGGNVTPATRNARQGRWFNASRALRRRGVAHREAALRWQPDGAAAEMYTRLRRQQKPTVSGLQLKEASIAMIADDPRIYGTYMRGVQHTPAGSGTAGRTYDRSYNVNFNWAAQRGTFTVTNIGDGDAPVIIELENAMALAAIQNLTTEEEISLNGATVNGETITIDTLAKTVTLQDGTNLFDRVEIPRTRWWGLAPGINTISFLAETFDASARVRVYHRPAWA